MDLFIAYRLPPTAFMKKIRSDMTIGGILKRNPEALKILERHGLSCANCSLSTLETLEEGAKAHGLSNPEISDLCAALSK
jgi:hybrid cluster-associated redox disulfide protein